MEYDKELGCWHYKRKIVPNWIPDDVKFNENYDDHMLDFGKKLLKLLKDKYEKKEENMNEKDTKIIVEQLEEKLKTLHSAKNSWTRQLAIFGNRLKECFDEIDNLEAVLEKLVDEDDEDDDE